MGTIDRSYRKTLSRNGIPTLDAKVAFYENVGDLCDLIAAEDFDAIRNKIAEHKAYVAKVEAEEAAAKEEEEADSE